MWGVCVDVLPINVALALSVANLSCILFFLSYYLFLIISCLKHWASKTLLFSAGNIASLFMHNPPNLHLATSEMWCWSGGRGILRKLSLCYSIVYYYNDAQRYKQFLQVDRLYRALILLGLALSSEHVGVFSLHDAIYIYIYSKKNLLTSFSLPFRELSLVGLALDVVD